MREARKHKQQRFDLYLDNPDEKSLHDFLALLGKKGKQREWIVKTLLEKKDRDYPIIIINGQ